MIANIIHALEMLYLHQVHRVPQENPLRVGGEGFWPLSSSDYNPIKLTLIASPSHGQGHDRALLW